jgi:hypothetical protein
VESVEEVEYLQEIEIVSGTPSMTVESVVVIIQLVSLDVGMA